MFQILINCQELFINRTIQIKSKEMFGFLGIHLLKTGKMSQKNWIKFVFSMTGKKHGLMSFFKVKKTNRKLIFSSQRFTIK